MHRRNHKEIKETGEGNTLYISNFTLPIKFFEKIENHIERYEWKSIVEDTDLSGKDTLSVIRDVLISKYAVDVFSSVESYEMKNDKPKVKDANEGHLPNFEIPENGFVVMSNREYLEHYAKDKSLTRIIIDNRCVVFKNNGVNVDTERQIEDMEPLDIILALSLLKGSRLGCFLLLRYDDIAMFNVDIIAAQWRNAWNIYERLLCECRSVVIELKTLSIASLPFYKFRNLDEAQAYSMENTINRINQAKRVEFTDKMDGSFVQMRYIGNDFPECEELFKDDVLISTSGTLTKESNEHLKWIYRFLDESGNENYRLMCKENPNLTFMFELICGGFDPHLVVYDKSLWGLYLIGIRNIETGELYFHDVIEDMSEKYGIPTAKIYDYNLDKVLEICHNAVATEREGFVLNADGWLVKIKLDDFVGLTRIINSASSFNSIIRIVVQNSTDDFLAKLPEPYKTEIAEKIQDLVDYNNTLSSLVPPVVEKLDKNNMKDSIGWINQNVPSPFRSFVIASLKGQNIPTFLAKKLDKGIENSSFLKEAQFIENVGLLNTWKENYQLPDIF